jgi:amino acid adenylation domain-containing protein
MKNATALHELLEHSALESPGQLAVEEADGASINYRDLAALADRLHGWLHAAGVRPGDRVGIYLRKSIDAVASIFGILQCGAAYVPIDPTAPPVRNAYILHNCQVRALVVEQRLAEAVKPELERIGAAPTQLILAGAGGGAPLREALDRELAPSPARSSHAAQADDLAYLLYTSGSTGAPKGVMLSHRNSLCFIDWCSDVFQPQSSDRFSSHAPFHFDLSILDLFVPIKHGATVVLFGESLGKDPVHLAHKIAERRISIWYSAPSILSMLLQQGRLELHDFSALRMVLFAGEVFPIKHLRALQSHWPRPRYFNLYGPTETNVCTWYEAPSNIPPDRTEPCPIGKVCSHYQERVIDAAGKQVPDGAEGELCISGPGVMQGYWSLSELNDRVFLVDADGTRWYRTGDIVERQPDGNFKFLGRRDRMIKKRGYRVELGEIESVLYRHPDVKQAAVIAIADEEHGVRVRAFLATQEGKRLSLIEMKRFCADRLPLYMVPDLFTFLDEMPKTSTDKVNYQRLRELP